MKPERNYETKKCYGIGRVLCRYSHSDSVEVSGWSGSRPATQLEFSWCAWIASEKSCWYLWPWPMLSISKLNRNSIQTIGPIYISRHLSGLLDLLPHSQKLTFSCSWAIDYCFLIVQADTVVLWCSMFSPILHWHKSPCSCYRNHGVD